MQRAVNSAIRRLVGQQSSLPESLEAVAFWSAIVLPFLYLPLLLVGLETVSLQVVFAFLLLLNAVMILLGHQYGR